MITHVETVVLLSQQKTDDHIEIEINLDEIDATSAETKATNNVRLSFGESAGAFSLK